MNLADLLTKPHTALTGVLTSQHHTKTVSGDINLADLNEKNLASLTNKNHASLSNVLTSQHHVKTVASELNLADLNEKAFSSLTTPPVNNGGVMQTNFAGASTFKLTNMIDPTADQDYCTKKYHHDNLPSVDAGIGKESNDIVHSNDTEREIDSPTYIKGKEIKCYLNFSGVRVSWEFKRVFANPVYSKLYVNGVAVGVEHDTMSATYVTVYDDITDIERDDLIQIYVHATSEERVAVQNMRIKYMEFENNDP